MLKRRSIKTKLVVALTLLLASVCLLATSGVIGLRRYRQLAESVSQGMREVRITNDLYRFAEALRLSNTRIDGPDLRSQILNSDALTLQARHLDDNHFDFARHLFRRNLESYEAIAQAGRRESLLIDADQRFRNIADIRDAFEDFESVLRKPEDADSYPARLKSRLDHLVAITERHAETLNANTNQFSGGVKATYRTWHAITLVCAAIAVILVGLLLWSFWAMLVQPFRTLLDGSRLVARGEFGHRIYLETGDELNELADAMNDMSDKFQSAYTRLDELRQNLEREVQVRTREVIRNEQLASVGFLAAGVAHEINNPLTTIAWAAESLESQIEEFSDADHAPLATALLSTLRQIQSEAFRCKGITDRLLDFSRMSEVRREPIDLTSLVADVVDLVTKVGEFRCKTVRTHGEDPVVAHVNGHQIRQVVLNLVTNALESVDANGSVDVTVRGDERYAYVTVDDDGCGMSEDVLHHLFEPFFTRRRDGTGTGLGLSITYRIVSQHGGKLLPSSPGVGLGSQMQLVLPLLPESGNQTQPHHQTQPDHQPSPAGRRPASIDESCQAA